MEEFYFFFRRGYINSLCDFILFSGFILFEKKKFCEFLRRREGILRDCLI